LPRSFPPLPLPAATASGAGEGDERDEHDAAP
jgi:hypothetical protein